jgi:hypothetical protein
VIKRESSEDDSDELYRDDKLVPAVPQPSASPTELQEELISAPAEQLVVSNTGGPVPSRKRGPNRSWEEHRINQSWESSFDSSSSSSSNSDSESDSAGLPPSPPPVSYSPTNTPTPAPLSVTPPQRPTPTSNPFTPQRQAFSQLRSPIQVLFLHHSPINLSPRQPPSADGSLTPSRHTPPYLNSPAARSSTPNIEEVLEQLPDTTPTQQRLLTDRSRCFTLHLPPLVLSGSTLETPLACKTSENFPSC